MAGKSLHTDGMAESGEEFEALYESNAPLIYRFMFWRTKDKMLAEDLTSSVFEKAWRSKDRFKGGSYTAWLHRIARNTLIDYWRKRRELTIDDQATQEIVSDEIERSELFDQALLINNLNQAIYKLPKDMQLILQSRFIEGLSARQVSKKLGLSEANVRVIQYRALKKLREYLNE